MNAQLAGFNQWSVYARLSKQFRWGKELPRHSDLAQYAAAHSPLEGSVEGVVMEQSWKGNRPAPGVAVSLVNFRSTVTDASGHYRFSSVPEGSYEVGLEMDRLPADYEPGPSTRARLHVQPRAVARADFSVFRLTFLRGRIVGLAGPLLANTVIRLAGTDRYTTPHQDGSFAFFNLREGEYEAVLDERTLPEGYLPASPVRVRVMASQDDAQTTKIEFDLAPQPVQEKPVHEILHEHIQLEYGGSTGRGRGQGGGGGNR